MRKMILLPLLALSLSANALVVRAYHSKVGCNLSDLYKPTFETRQDFILTVNNKTLMRLENFTPSDATELQLWCQGERSAARDARANGTGTGYLLIDRSRSSIVVEKNDTLCQN